MPLAKYIQALNINANNTMTPEEFVKIDKDAPANEELPADWEAVLICKLTNAAEPEEMEEDESEEEDPVANEPPQHITWTSCKKSLSEVFMYVQLQVDMPKHIIHMAMMLQVEMEKHAAKNIVLKQTILNLFFI